MGKKFLRSVLILFFITLLTIPSAEAGSKARYRWQGAAMALGAVALGGLIAHQIHAHVPPPPAPVVLVPPREPSYCPPRTEYVPGRWEVVREWVPGTCERVWVPGHYDRCGNWVPGHYEYRETPGYYVERRVWVEGHWRHY
ncbi:MAG: hypothetical protein N3G78_11975 [Desulfobacterota bacterium]|nr:hypothetical protein [Thermodesulfobacteriota bacterium]